MDQPAKRAARDKSRFSAVGFTTMVVKSSRPDAGVIGDFVRIAHRIVWCTLATVDRRGRPRSRVVHPYWERDVDGLTGWMFTRSTSPKIAHLAHRSHISCSYWDPA